MLRSFAGSCLLAALGHLGLAWALAFALNLGDADASSVAQLDLSSVEVEFRSDEDPPASLSRPSPVSAPVSTSAVSVPRPSGYVNATPLEPVRMEPPSSEGPSLSEEPAAECADRAPSPDDLMEMQIHSPQDVTVPEDDLSPAADRMRTVTPPSLAKEELRQRDLRIDNVQSNECSVMVECLVNAKGKVEKVTIEEIVGLDGTIPELDVYAAFAQATRKIARKLRFNPAQVDGRPVMGRVKIPFQYRQRK